jgi:hypothetical protein
MGKAGKARKKQKLLAHATDEDFLSDCDESDCDSSNNNNLLDTAVLVLNTLSTRMKLYDGKPLKPLRIALYPLIQRQLDKFFEDPPPAAVLSEQEVSLLLAPPNIAATLRIAQTLTQQPEIFASLENKDFRRALHPFVLYQIRKSSLGASAKPTSSSGGKALYPSGWASSPSTSTSTSTADTPGHELMNLASADGDKKKQSLSNRVAYCYRVGDWPGALAALHELRVSSDMPKLGE